MNIIEFFNKLFGNVSLPVQIIGFIGVLISFFIYIFKDRRKILICKFTSDAVWSVHYFFVGAISGAALNVVGLFREIVFYNKNKKWASHFIWPFVFISITIASCLITWQGPRSLLPMIGSTFGVLGFYSTNPLLIRILSLPSILLWMIYGIISGSFPSLICNILSLTSIMIGLVRDIKGFISKRKTAAV